MTELEVLDRNVLMRFKQHQRGHDNEDRRVNRGSYTEAEVRALLASANARERALIGVLCFTGIRPGEAYALCERDLDLVQASASINRNWDWRGKVFTLPKTESGRRTVALSGWLVAQITSYLATRRRDPDALLFANRNGHPLNPINVRRDIWIKLVARAGVRALDMYSLRHTFAGLGLVAGEEAFNVARAMGHSRSRLVDEVYAHALPSGMASVAERVTARALGKRTKLRVIAGKPQDIRRSLDELADLPESKAVSN